MKSSGNPRTNPPRVLVACEESQRVTEAFRKVGCEAFSCDIKETSGSHPEWHIVKDVLRVINGNCHFTTQDGARHRIRTRWDCVIAFPPCTHLTRAGSRHYDKWLKDGRQRDSIEFFGKVLNADCDIMCIENPIGIISRENGWLIKNYPDLCEKYGLPKKFDQIIQPYMFGDSHVKSTCLWLKGLPKLEPLFTEPPTDIEYYEHTRANGRVDRVDAMFNKWSEESRPTMRSKTFQGVADAMAAQWGKILLKDHKHISECKKLL